MKRRGSEELARELLSMLEWLTTFYTGDRITIVDREPMEQAKRLVKRAKRILPGAPGLRL